MEAFLKRSSNSDCSNELKKTRLEICPHAAKCYRRNPHHFKEFQHPNLDEFLQRDEPLQLPSDYPQEKEIVIAQLEILKGLRKGKTEITVKPTTSNSDNVRLSSRNKTTTYSQAKSHSNSSISISSRTMMQRLQENEPYNLFFTTIPDISHTLHHKNSITFTDLLCPSLGDLKCSLQMNFVIDIAWLMEQYKKMGQDKKPLTILYGDDWPDMKKYIEMMLPNVTEHHVKIKDPFGIHHSKVGIYVYTDNSIRVVVSTANLYYEDWNYYNQGLWISPLCPPLASNGSDLTGDGPTSFKTSLVNYLNSYNLPILKEWINYVKRANFSAVKVHLVTSVPGKHTATIKPAQCHLHRVGDLLSKNCSIPAKVTATDEGPLAWGIIGQCSSIGNLGKVPGEWLRSMLLRSLASHKDCILPSNSSATISIIYPTKMDVLNSRYGPQGGGCLPYSKEAHEKQKWLNDYLHCWKANHTNRSKAMPHIKTYCRISPCTTKLAWFLLSSANLSKAAWGNKINGAGSSYVRSYEVGVMFLPKDFNEPHFYIKSNNETDRLFPCIYDIPLRPYASTDQPWCN